jgi:hypothetical protein
MRTDEEPTSSLHVYRTYLEERRCWIDGEPTHASSGSQRQCPKCRTKWSYDGRLTEVALLDHYCQGTNAAQAARSIGCARNTAMSHYACFRFSMEQIIAAMLTRGELATNPVTLRELQSLEKALRAGSYRSREKACRHLFVHSLNQEERLAVLFRESLAPELKTMVAEAVRRLNEPDETQRICYALSYRRREGTAKPLPPREEEKNFWHRFWARWDPNSPEPSAACERMGQTWVEVWRRSRDAVRGVNPAVPES